jgi:hypothetical protein
MYYTIALLVISVVLLKFRSKIDPGLEAFATVAGLVSLCLGLFIAAPILGYGHVSASPRALSEVLDKGPQYQMVAQPIKDGDDEIIVVKRTGCVSTCYRVIRTAEGNLPTNEFFVLDKDGNPLADGPIIAWPHPPAPTCGPIKPVYDLPAGPNE